MVVRNEEAQRDRGLRFLRMWPLATEGPARPTRARRGHLPADRVAARLTALARVFEREGLPVAVVLGRLREVAAFAPEPLSTVLHTLAKGAERGAHRERVRLPPIPPLVRVHPTDLVLEQDVDNEARPRGRAGRPPKRSAEPPPPPSRSGFAAPPVPG